MPKRPRLQALNMEAPNFQYRAGEGQFANGRYPANWGFYGYFSHRAILLNDIEHRRLGWTDPSLIG